MTVLIALTRGWAGGSFDPAAGSAPRSSPATRAPRRCGLLTVGRKLASDPAVNSDRIAYPQGYGIERYRKARSRPPTTSSSAPPASTSAEPSRSAPPSRTRRPTSYAPWRTCAWTGCSSSPTGRPSKDGHLPAIDRALRIMGRRARMNGLDRPAKIEIVTTAATGSELTAMALDELEALISISEEAAHGSDD